MNIIAFTGAGISKSAGIPTFEEVPNLKQKLSVDFKEKYPQEFYDAMFNLVNSVRDKEPTKAHKALAEYDIPIITMNVDCLHTKAGSKQVYEIHGNYREDNIVLYGQEMHHVEDVLTLIIQISKEYKEEAIFLIIGTSMQTAFAHTLAQLATQLGMRIHIIDKNADEEVPIFLKENVIKIDK